MRSGLGCKAGKVAQPLSDLTGAAYKDCEFFTLKAPHRKVSEATVLRRLVKSEAILAAEVQSACFLFDSFSFCTSKREKNEQNKL